MSDTNRTIDVSYDEVADVLYVTIAPITLTKNDEAEAGLVLRYDLKTRRPVGATVLDFHEYWGKQAARLEGRLASFLGVTAAEAHRAIQAALH